MAHPEDPFAPGSPASPRFATTRWSLVLAAGGTDSQAVRPAISHLIERYWYPLYAFVRRKGRDAEEACDLTQEFLSRLIDRNLLTSADPAKGKFRTFLLSALQNFLVDEWRRESSLRRGGGRRTLSFSALDAEDRYRLEPADNVTPEVLYERRWAMALIEEAMGRLGKECAAAGRQALFTAVEPVLAGDGDGGSYAEIAARLDMTEAALKTAVHRLRRRFAAIVRAEIAETVADAADVEEEVQHLLRRLR